MVEVIDELEILDASEIHDRKLKAKAFGTPKSGKTSHPNRR